MRKLIIIILGLVWLICAPTYVSIDYARSEHIDFEDINSDAYVWTHTSIGGFYFLLGNSYLDNFNGKASFMFNTWNEEFTHVHISSAKIIVNDTDLDISLPFGDFAFGHGSRYSNGKMNRTAMITFQTPLENQKSTPQIFEINISGYVYGQDGVEKEFSYQSNIRKTNKTFIIPLYKHIYYRLTIT